MGGYMIWVTCYGIHMGGLHDMGGLHNKGGLHDIGYMIWEGYMILVT